MAWPAADYSAAPVTRFRNALTVSADTAEAALPQLLRT